MAPRIGAWVAWSFTVPVMATAALRENTRLTSNIVMPENFKRIKLLLGGKDVLFD
jgi:hypothetical protein